MVETLGTHYGEDHDAVGPRAGAAEKLETTDGLKASDGDASTVSGLSGLYLNGHLSACKTSEASGRDL